MIVSALETRRQSLPTSVAGWRSLLWGGIDTAAGAKVSADTAMQHATVYACTRVLAESIAQLPLILYRRTGERTRERATDHPLYPLLHTLSNGHQTAFQARELQVTSMVLRGNAIAFVERGGSGAVESITPLRWDSIELRPNRDCTDVVFDYSPGGGGVRTFLRSEVWHIPGMGFDGYQGVSPITLMRETIGHGLAMQDYSSKFYSEGAVPLGAYKYPTEMSDDQYTRLAEALEARHQGTRKTAILEGGMEWQDIGISQKDSEYLEGRKFNRSEIAGIFRVPPHMIGDLERATFSNIEHQAIDFAVYTLGPWLKRIEQTITQSLLTAAERETYYAEFLVDGLLRGDSETRSRVKNTGILNGSLTRNEARAMENLPPLDGLDEPLAPLNMATPTDTPARSIEPTELRTRHQIEVRGSAERAKIARGFRPAFEEAALRTLRAERREIEKMIGVHFRDADSFMDELERLYAEDSDLRRLMERHAGPTVRAMAASILAATAAEIGGAMDEAGLDEFVAALVGAYVARHVMSSRAGIRAAVLDSPEDPAAAVRATFDTWIEDKPARIARKETVHQSRAIAKQAYARSGVEKLVWVTTGDSCPFCERLDGKLISIEGDFVTKGETFEAEGRKPLNIRTSIGHPPLHSGCDCDIAPG